LKTPQRITARRLLMAPIVICAFVVENLKFYGFLAIELRDGNLGLRLAGKAVRGVE